MGTPRTKYEIILFCPRTSRWIRNQSYMTVEDVKESSFFKWKCIFYLYSKVKHLTEYKLLSNQNYRNTKLFFKLIFKISSKVCIKQDVTTLWKQGSYSYFNLAPHLAHSRPQIFFLKMNWVAHRAKSWVPHVNNID